MVRRYFILLFSLFVLFAGAAPALGNCFERLSHHDDDQDHHHAANGEIVLVDYHGRDDAASRIHCPDVNFRLTLARMSSSSNFKTQLDEDRLYNNFDSAVQETASALMSSMLVRAGKIPPHLLQLSLSPHLLLPVLRI